MEEEEKEEVEVEGAGGFTASAREPLQASVPWWAPARYTAEEGIAAGAGARRVQTSPSGGARRCRRKRTCCHR
jgi:hypothetical protein